MRCNFKIRLSFNRFQNPYTIMTERSEGVSFECIWYSIKVATRPGPARSEFSHAFTKLITFFYFCTEWTKISHIDRSITKLHDFSSCKNTKKCFSNIFKRFLKNFLGQSFQKLLWLMYPRYQLYMLLYRQSFTIQPLSNEITYII